MNKIAIHNFLPSISFEMTKLYSIGDFWKCWIYYYLFDLLKKFDIELLKEKIEKENLKKQSKIEDCITKFIRRYLSQNEKLIEHFDIGRENLIDESEKVSYYDITIFNTYWRNSFNKKEKFHLECKNLDKNQEQVYKYIYYNNYKKYDKLYQFYAIGVYHFFNGKSASDYTSGRMIFFVFSGNLNTIKSKIKAKLNNKFDITPKGDLISITDNSLAKNPFTFDRIHQRNGKKFLVHHLMFDFT